METVKYIAVTYRDAKVANPYWSQSNDGIESEFIDQLVVTPVHIYSDKELKRFLLENEPSHEAIKYYKVEQIYPRVETTHTVSF